MTEPIVEAINRLTARLDAAGQKFELAVRLLGDLTAEIHDLTDALNRKGPL